MSVKAPEFVVNHPKKAGVVVLLLALGLIAIGLLWPLYEASQGTQNITLSVKAAVGGVVFAVVGVLFLLLGSKAVTFVNPDPSNISGAAIAFYVVLMVIAFASYAGLAQFLVGEGYTVE